MDDIIKLSDQYYIVAPASRSRGLARVLKSGETFAVFNHAGDIEQAPGGDHGVYY